MSIVFLTTEDERKIIKNLDLTNESEFKGLDYVMQKAEERAGRRLN